MQKNDKSENKGKRLNKYLSDAGVCSRREADRLIAMGRVRVVRSGVMLPETGEKLIGMRLSENDDVLVDRHLIDNPDPKKIYILLNKPKGIVCTAEQKTPNNVISFLGLDRYVTYVGRLDKDSTGLLLLTNDGELNNRMMRAANYHEKEYICTVDRPITPDFLKAMKQGVRIKVMDSSKTEVETRTRPCRITKRGENEFSIVLTQGLNRQIRKMCEALGYKTLTINRVRIMNLKIGSLPLGAHRSVTDEELKELKALIEKGCTEGNTKDA